jgi:hypothetical protein
VLAFIQSFFTNPVANIDTACEWNEKMSEVQLLGMTGTRLSIRKLAKVPLTIQEYNYSQELEDGKSATDEPTCEVRKCSWLHVHDLFCEGHSSTQQKHALFQQKSQVITRVDGTVGHAGSRRAICC